MLHAGRPRSIRRSPLSLLCLASLSSLAATASGCGSGPADALGSTQQATSTTPRYDVDLHQTSVSGLSSGGFMAVQFQVAFSSTVRGAAIFAGGPYACARGHLSTALTTCMSASGPFDVAPLVALTRQLAAAGAIDPVESLATQRVFLFGGADDRTVNPSVMDGLAAYYSAFVSSDPAAPGDVAYVRRRPGTGHTMPTIDEGVPCGETRSPYLGRCGYDGAGEALAQIYGALAPRSATPSGSFVTIAQGEHVASPAAHSLADHAYAYVPRSCSEGERCRVHVAFHGCQQAASVVGDAFYRRAGYNEWADTNHLIVLYPQTVASPQNRNACWDWFGYDSPDYAKKSGPQLAMVHAMVESLATATRGDGGAPDPATPAPPSPPDPPVDGVRCVVASNAEHVAQGRARVVGLFTFAAGSSQPLGVYSTLVRTSLRETVSGFWSVGSCG